MNLTLDHIQLAIPPGSEATCRGFWTGLLGCAEIDKPPALKSRGGAWFRIGAQELHLGVEADFAPARKAHPAFLVADIDDLAARLSGPVRWDVAIAGRRRFFTEDPVGNRLEFIGATG